jgi:folate-binding protein YgfZ
VTPVATLEEETEALRRGAGAFRASRDVLAVRGPDAETYLQGQLSQDVAALAVGATADALLLEPDGKLTALVRITRTDGQGFVLDLDAGFGDAVTARLHRFLLRSKVEMEHLAWRCLCLRGSAVGEVAAGLLTVLAERGVLALPFDWHGWSGVDLLGPGDVVLGADQADLPAGVVACGAEAVEACRIVSGIPAMGTELSNKTIAAEAGLVERTVSFTKGCFTGQELVARIDARGSNVRRGCRPCRSIRAGAPAASRPECGHTSSRRRPHRLDGAWPPRLPPPPTRSAPRRRRPSRGPPMR